MKYLIILSMLILNAGCATSGVQQIQKKCQPVQNLADTWVCETP